MKTREDENEGRKRLLVGLILSKKYLPACPLKQAKAKAKRKGYQAPVVGHSVAFLAHHLIGEYQRNGTQKQGEGAEREGRRNLNGSLSRNRHFTNKNHRQKQKHNAGSQYAKTHNH